MTENLLKKQKYRIKRPRVKTALSLCGSHSNHGSKTSDEERYRQLFIHSKAVQLLLDPIEGRIIDANPAASHYYGYSIETLKSLNIYQISVLFEHEIDARLQEIKEEKYGCFNSQHRLASGEIRDVEIHVSLIRFYDQCVLYTIIHDITDRKQAQAQLAKTLFEQELILNNSLVGIAFLNKHWQFIRVNKRMEELFGYAALDLINNSADKVYPSQEDYRTYIEHSSSALHGGNPYIVERLMRHATGNVFWCRLLGKMIEPNDPAKGFIWNVEDISEQKRAEEKLLLAATVFTTVTEAIIVTDAATNIITVNPAFTTITGYTEEEVCGKTPRILSSEHHDKHFYQNLWENIVRTGRWQGEMWNRRKDKSLYVESLSITTVKDKYGRVTHYVGVFSDITKRKKSEANIYHRANYDALTDLPNRHLFIDRLSQALHLAKRDKNLLALLFVDLDKFKTINDTLGHAAGDDLLKQTAVRLINCVRESDTVARLGGDEFTIILSKINKNEDTQVVANRILEEFSQPFILKEKTISVSASIGIAIFPEDGQHIDTLLKNADSAMYKAKNKGRNRVCFFREDV